MLTAGTVAWGGYLGVAYSLYCDAAARGSQRPGVWAVAGALFNRPVLAYYLVLRNRIGERTVPVTTAEQIARTVALAVILSMGGGAVLTPPDPYSQIRFLGPSLLATLPLAYGLLVGRDLVRADPDVIE